MAGTFIEGTSKVLSGVYTLIKAVVAAVIMGARGVAAYPFTSNWGPVNVLTLTIRGSEFDGLFNPSTNTLTAKIVSLLAFLGKPQKVLAYRMATNAAAQGAVTLNDGAAALALQLKTKYPSDRAFKATIADAVGGGKNLKIVEGTTTLVDITGTTTAELVAKLVGNDYVVVTNSGAELPANIANAPFAGGNNGSVVTATEYSAFLSEVEADGTANSFALDGVSDEAILTVAETWLRRVRSEGLYITWARGGPTGWDTTPGDANTKSKALNHRGIINVGNGVDTYTAAQMAIFIAARVAGVALNRGLTDEPVPFTTVNKKLLPGQRETAKVSGTLVFVMENGVPVIDEAVNTLTVPVADETVEMGKIRVNNTLDAVSKDLEAFGNAYKNGRSNTQPARLTYAATVEENYFKPLVDMEVLQPGCYYRPDPTYHSKTATKVAKIDEAFFEADITPVDSMERIYQKIGVSF
jgi:hypothetical protein